MVNLLSILAAILAGHLIQPAAGQFNPHSALPIHATGRWGWNGTQSLRQMNVSFAAPRELLFQNEMAVWPVHTTILKNLLQDVVKGQMKLQKLVPPACNFFDASIEKWHALVYAQKPLYKTLTRAEYLEALQALRAATYQLKTTCRIQDWWLPIVQAPTFEVLMDNILLIGLVYDASGWDSMPAFLSDLPWLVVRDLVEISNIDVEEKFKIIWQDEEI